MDLALRKVLQEVWHMCSKHKNRDAHEVLCSGDPEKPFIMPSHVLYTDKKTCKKHIKKCKHCNPDIC